MHIQLVSETNLFRQGLHALLEKEQGINFLPPATCKQNCFQSCYASKSDAIIMDINNGRYCRMDCIHQIIIRHPTAKIIALIRKENFSQTNEALKHGAKGVISLEADASLLTHAVRTVASGDMFIDPSLAQAITEAQFNGISNPFEKLSSREKTVLQLVLDGHDSDTCASMLSISKKTVSNHYTQILKKLAVKNRVQLTRLAIRHNMIKA